MRWKDIIENSDPNENVEIADANVYFKNQEIFIEAGLTVDKLLKLFPLLEQQLWSVLALFKLVKTTGAESKILEIGSGKGGSLATMALANETAELINIDNFERYTEETHAGLGVNFFYYEEFKENMKKLGIDNRVSTIKKWSDDAVDLVPNNHFDLIFIDGNHGYKNLLNDISNYKPKVKAGGILCGHDYHPRFPGVIKAVKQAFHKSEFSVYNNSSIWVTKCE